MENQWTAYLCKSGQTFILHNKTTGEFKWPSSLGKGSQPEHRLICSKKFSTTATQTDNNGCINGCTSMYVDTDPCRTGISATTLHQKQPSVLNQNNALKNTLSSSTSATTLHQKQPSVSNQNNSSNNTLSSNTSATTLHQKQPSVSNRSNASNGTANSNTLATSLHQKQPLVSNQITALNSSSGSTNASVGQRNEQGQRLGISQNNSTNNKHRDNHSDDVDGRTLSNNLDEQEILEQLLSTPTMGSAGDNVVTCDGSAAGTSSINEQEYADDCYIGLEEIEDDDIDNYEKDMEGNVVNCDGNMDVPSSVHVFMNDHDYCHRYPDEHATNTNENIPGEMQENVSAVTGIERLVCPTCKKVFSSKHTLETHSLVHTQEKDFECSYCKKKFVKLAYMKLHMRLHTGENLHECSYCKKKFYTREKLKLHIRMHTDERPYECPYCQKKFRRNENLKKHGCFGLQIALNEGECTKCSKKLASKSEISEHVKMHTLNLPFECSFCKKRFSQKHTLNNHMKLHGEKPFKCSICSKAFISKSFLNKHVEVHFNVKPFECSFCGLKFRGNSGLKRHKNIHTGEKPFSCTFCDEKFARKGNLKKHLKSHEQLPSDRTPPVHIKVGAY